MSPPLLTASGLTVRFGGLIAVNEATLEVAEGEIHGLIGPNGAGKTTFFNALSGLVATTSGRVELAGVDITALAPHDRASFGMRRTFQSVQLIPQFTVLENVLIGLHDQIREPAWRSLFSWSGRSRAEDQAQQRVLDIVRMLGIENALFRVPAELTFVEQRLAEIARALVSRPKIVMLDEPAAGLSPSEVTALNQLLRRLRNDWNLTIVLVEHVLSLVLDVSDRVTVLDRGEVISRGTPQQVSSDPQVKIAYLGDDDHA